MAHGYKSLRENPYLIPSLIVLLAAIIFAASNLSRPAVSSQMLAASGQNLPSNLVPATADTPAHLATPAGQPNPTASLAHYASYSPQYFAIKSVGGASITGTFNGAATPVTLAVTANTDIYGRGAEKDPATYQKEMADFQDAIQYADSNDVYVAPDPFVHTPLSLSDLRAGMTVMVSSSDGKTADTIFVQNR